MKKLLLIIPFLACTAAAIAQDDYDDAWCKGLKNPTSFIITNAGNYAHAQWSGLVGTKASTSSTCDNWGATGLSLITANQLATQASGSSCTPGYDSATYQNRFLIVYPGTDELTGNHLQKVPAEYTSAIRLGNRCGGADAEMLMYQFDVRLKNSIMILNYALSLQNGQHSADMNPEFYIVVERMVGSNWVRIGHDTLCYIQQAPDGAASTFTGADTAFYVGATGTHTGAAYGCNIYTQWRKVAINLNQYLFETVRIKIGIGDCEQSTHYAYAYIAAECQPMEIMTPGCQSGTPYLQRLTAPMGMDYYQWARCTSGRENIENMTLVDETRAHFVNITGAEGPNYNVYECQLNDFLMTEGSHLGEYSHTQVFKCTMTSRTNPSIPDTCKIYTEVINKKPLLYVDTTFKDCDGRIRLKDISYVPGLANGVDTALTKWEVFSSPDCNATPDTIMYGSTIMHQFDSLQPANHAIRMTAYAAHTPDEWGDTAECYTTNEFHVYSLGRPEPVIIASAHEIADTEQVTLTDATQPLSPQLTQGRDWIIDGDTVWGIQGGILTGENQRYSRSLYHDTNIVEMRAYNGLYYLDSLDQSVRHYCSNSIADTIHLFHSTPTGIADAEAGSTFVTCQQNCLTVHGAAHRTIRIYDAAGRLLSTKQDASDEQVFRMPAAGIYLVQIDDRPVQRVSVAFRH